MKLIKLTLLLFCVAGLFACRKTNSDPDIKQYDDDQIKAYIAANGLTGMKRDAGDTTGIYYQIIKQGTGPQLNYDQQASLVFTLRSMDGKFANTDTISNHVYDFVGHIPQNTYLNKGVMLAVMNMMKTQGTRARVLIPSRLGFGATGAGSGSSSGNNRIAGNQSLDYYLNVVAVDGPEVGTGKILSGTNAQANYDSLAIRNYITANALTGFTAITVPSGGRNYTMYYKITQASSGGAVIGTGSIVEIQYTSFLLNGFITSDTYNSESGIGVSVDLGADTRAGIVAGLLRAKGGDKLSLIMPSQLVYGKASTSSTNIPVNSCLRYDFNIISVDK